MFKEEESLKSFIFYTILFITILCIRSANNASNLVIDDIMDNFNQNQHNILESAKTEFNIDNNDFQRIQEKFKEYNEQIKKLFLPNQQIKNFHYDGQMPNFAKKVFSIIENSGLVPHTIRLYTDNEIKFAAQSDLMLDKNNNCFFLITCNTNVLGSEAKKHFVNHDIFLSSIVRGELSRIIWCCNGIIDFLMPHFQKKQHTTDSLKTTEWFKCYLRWRETIMICYHSTISSSFAFDTLFILLSRYSLIKNNTSLKNLIFEQINNHLYYCQNIWNLNTQELLQTYCTHLLQTYNDVKKILENNHK